VPVDTIFETGVAGLVDAGEFVGMTVPAIML
jgi:hypothetical protein